MGRVDAPGPYQLFTLALCVYVLLALGAQTVVTLDASTRTILDVADFVVCLLFLADFLWSLVRAPRKWDYLLRWGWIDLLSAIPTIDAFRWGRAARAFRVLRVLRGVKSMRLILVLILERRAASAFLAAALVSILLIVFAAIAVLEFEPGAEGANIGTAEDALWWAFVTITTVGYGDRFPVTSEGRILAAFLMIAGVGLFGTFTGFVASWFLEDGGSRTASTQETVSRSMEDADAS